VAPAGVAAGVLVPLALAAAAGLAVVALRRRYPHLPLTEAATRLARDFAGGPPALATFSPLGAGSSGSAAAASAGRARSLSLGVAGASAAASASAKGASSSLLDDARKAAAAGATAGRGGYGT